MGPTLHFKQGHGLSGINSTAEDLSADADADGMVRCGARWQVDDTLPDMQRDLPMDFPMDLQMFTTFH